MRPPEGYTPAFDFLVRRSFGSSFAALAFVIQSLSWLVAAPPNVILILTDDLGYGDAPGHGERAFAMPNVERLAAEGMRFTDYYSASAVCSSSRASLLTGRYGVRTGVTGVISANSATALPLEEITLAERFKALGYATAIFGKWHLGNTREFWPLRQGFDEWLGTIGSNDMGKGRPSLEERRLGRAGVEMVQNEEVIEINPDQRLLTRRYTERAVDFIQRQRSGPFFLYVPHNMPHTPLFVSERFEGVSGRGLYGDVLAELDWSLGEIMRAVDEGGLRENTIIAFTSDNGPWLIFGDHGGTAGLLDGGKKQTLEGGFRVPMILRWPGRVPAGSVCRGWVSALDFTPTLMAVCGGETEGVELDGRDVSAWWLGRFEEPVADKPLFYFYERELQGVRAGKWKLRMEHIDTQAPDLARIGMGGARGETMKVRREQALFDLESDPGEERDFAAGEPEVVRRLRRLADEGLALAGDQPGRKS
jgi:arylsulfatase A